MPAICADTILYNARMHDPDGKPSDATAIASMNGRIVYIGDDEGARSLVFEREDGTPNSGAVREHPAERGPLDLKGALILPGLTDAHLHFSEIALGLSQVNVEKPDIVGAIDAVADRARSLKPGEWLLGYGWNHNVWGGVFPRAADLDRVAPRNPVMLQDKSGHAVWVNKAALSLAGIDRDTPDPADGKILRDPDGSLSGILLEGACALVMRIVPKPTVEEIAAAMW